jgi:predicted phosphodiesterase
MRIGVLADVHANLPALEACLRALERSGVDAYACLGDLVGYGAEPDACIARIAELGATSVAGNHDLIALGRAPMDGCGPLARRTLEWTRGALSPESRAFLDGLPLAAELGGARLAHGSVDDPWAAIDTVPRAREALASLPSGATLLLVGHTHVPLVVAAGRGALVPGRRGRVALDPRERTVLNPGSVGQSRCRLPRARCATLDLATGEAVLHALRYDARRSRAALRAAGLPVEAGHPTTGRLRRRWNRLR